MCDTAQAQSSTAAGSSLASSNSTLSQLHSYKMFVRSPGHGIYLDITRILHSSRMQAPDLHVLWVAHVQRTFGATPHLCANTLKYFHYYDSQYKSCGRLHCAQFQHDAGHPP